MGTGNEVRKPQAGEEAAASAAGTAVAYRLMELENEKLSLQRLVAELLVKNQKLRESLARVPAAANPGARLSSL